MHVLVVVHVLDHSRYSTDAYARQVEHEHGYAHDYGDAHAHDYEDAHAHDYEDAHAHDCGDARKWRLVR